jgi:hypothetical protein
VKRSGCLFFHYFILLCLTKNFVASERLLSEVIANNNNLEKNEILEKMLIYSGHQQQWATKRKLDFNYISSFVKDFDIQKLKEHTFVIYYSKFFVTEFK